MTKLEKMLQYVSEHNDFYKQRIKDYGITNPLDITQWPILTRKELQENRYNMFSEGYKTKYYNQQLRRQSSSGSTGMPVNVYWDYKDWYASNMCLWRKRWEWYGIKPNDKYCIFTLNAFDLSSNNRGLYYINSVSNVMQINVSLIQDDEGYYKLTSIINDFSPTWLLIQPFVLNKLIQSYQCEAIHPPQSLKYIESIGEYLPTDLARRAMQCFNVSVVNMYGSEEMNGVAFECPKHHLHILEDNVYVEIKNDSIISKFGEGDAIITSLNNCAMPLIRYYQGDRIIVRELKSPCEFDCGCDIIEIIKGRSSNCLKTNDKEINSYMLTELIAEVNNQLNDVIREYKYVYKRKNDILTCYININEKDELWYTNVQRLLIKTLQHKFVQSLPFQFEICKYSFNSSNKNRKNNILAIID